MSVHAEVGCPRACPVKHARTVTITRALGEHILAWDATRRFCGDFMVIRAWLVTLRCFSYLLLLFFLVFIGFNECVIYLSVLDFICYFLMTITNKVIL